MPEGGCLCGKIRISFEGEPEAKVLCHCADCRKITGSAFSTNALVPAARFAVAAGQPRTLERRAESGNPITSHFCGDCGTTLWREGPGYAGFKIVKTGVLDDPAATFDALRPAAELFVRSRAAWLSPIPGAEQKETA
ncbi:Mss4-like protein [Durotheca rogersii]|uniref:Mss4-like protein n=1 Tax=Durotheca rogersii TaxID=419775 RepID=UPI0022207E74|nr:Mss4-like protein [Durotheca rogersii]KAI5866296.1 Mss4-like protein [Durotheca rogersii]